MRWSSSLGRRSGRFRLRATEYGGSDPSSDDFGKYASRELIGDPFLAAFPLEHQVAMVRAQKMKHRGVEVMHAHLVFGRAVSDFIGRAVRGAALDPTACHPDAEARGAVVASGGGPRPLRDRQPAELAPPYPSRAIHHPPPLQLPTQS